MNRGNISSRQGPSKDDSCNRKTLVILAHPRGQSTLCGALAEAFADGVRRVGAEVRVFDLSTLDFDVHVRQPSPKDQSLEPHLDDVRKAIEWADHLVFVYPTW